eukprot:5341778-Alexandrium_andersonii.AAC.1
MLRSTSSPSRDREVVAYKRRQAGPYCRRRAQHDAVVFSRALLYVVLGSASSWLHAPQSAGHDG